MIKKRLLQLPDDLLTTEEIDNTVYALHCVSFLVSFISVFLSLIFLYNCVGTLYMILIIIIMITVD